MVGQRVHPSDSTGWTAIILERASRFLVEQQCGRKTPSCLKGHALGGHVHEADPGHHFSPTESAAMATPCSNSVPRRCGPGSGPSPQDVAKGCRVRLKNKGSQRHRRGPKRPKYQAPNPNIPTPARYSQGGHPRQSSGRPQRGLYGGATVPFGAEPTPMPRTPTRCNALWTCICCNTTSSVHTGPPVRYRPCDWASWRPLCALKRS